MLTTLIQRALATPLLAGLLLTQTACQTTGQAAASAVSAAASASASAAVQIDASTAEAAAFEALAGLKPYEAQTAQNVTLSGGTVSFSGSGASVDGSTVTITAPGAYAFTGTLTNGQIIVDSAAEENVYLILNNASVTCADGPAIYVKECGKNVYLSCPDGTVNTLADGATRVDEALDACVYSTADLFLNGSGSLTITGAFADGIHSKDDLRVTETALTVTAADDGLVGKDALVLGDTAITVDAAGDALKSSSTEDGRGYVAIASGDYDLTSGCDGVQAESVLYIADGTFTITAGGGSANAPVQTRAGGFGGGGGGRMSGERPDDGAAPEGFQKVGERPADGTMPERPQDGTMPERPQDGERSMKGGEVPTAPQDGQATGSAAPADAQTAETEDADGKGLKAGVSVRLDGGSFTLDCADDGIHSNDSVTIAGGTYTVSSGDDGVHADGLLTLAGGTLDVLTSYEGLEGRDVTIAGGTTNVTASDDGVNASGSDGASDGVLTITGGTVTVDAGGDGVDVNGSATMSGGTLLVYGPANTGNGALDYDGSFTVTGGTLAALGMSGMAQSISSDSTQLVAAGTVSSTAGKVTLTDADGTVLLTLDAPRAFNHIVLSLPALTDGGSYTLTGADGVQTTLTAGMATAQAGGMGGQRGNHMQSKAEG